MVTERTIINALIIGAAFILVPFIISSSLTLDYVPALFFGGLTALAVAFIFLKDNLCIWPYIGCFIQGALNFLPLPLKALHIFSILLIIYYITGYIIIRQKRISLGKTKFLWPILIVTFIVLYHNHDLHVHSLGTGGETEGSKPAFFIYLVVLAYFCGINVATPSVDFLRKVPLYCLICTALSSIPYLLTTFIPSLAPYLYYITDTVNVQAYMDTQTGSKGPSGVGRLAALGPLGGTLQLYLLCHYPIGTWLRPQRWWVAGLSLICVVLVISSGYRNVLFGFMIGIIIAVWCFYSWRALLLPVVLSIAWLLFYVATSNNLINMPLNKLPMIAQRTMSFLPGDWDREAIESAKDSNHFRDNIQDVYWKEYLKKSPLFGNGFSINTKDYTRLNDLLLNGGSGLDKDYLNAKIFIEGKLFHTGWISLYDCVGIIGGMAFIALGWNEISVTAHFIFGPKADRGSPLFPCYVWLLCGILPGLIAFFTVFGDFGQSFQGFCVSAIVLSHLIDVENTTEVSMVLSDRKEQLEHRPLIGSGSPYGGGAGRYR
jgi:hypothetical protein